MISCELLSDDTEIQRKRDDDDHEHEHEHEHEQEQQSVRLKPGSQYNVTSECVYGMVRDIIHTFSYS